MDLSPYKETDFIFHQEIKFSKWELDRDVFPYKSNRILLKSEHTTRENDKNLDDSNYEGSVYNKGK